MATGIPSEHATLTISGDDHEVLTLAGREAVSELFSLELRCAPRAGAPTSPAGLLGEPAHVTLRDGFGQVRHVHGVVARAERLVSDRGEVELSILVRPAHYQLTLGRTCRNFQDHSVVDIARKVLAAIPAPVSFRLVSSYPERVYTAQYREDDWTFLSRLFEEEGIYTWYEHAEDASTLVVSDASPYAPELPGGARVPFVADSDLRAAREAIEELGEDVSVKTTRFTVGSFDPQRPLLKVTASEGEDGHEYYDAPGGGPESPAVIARRAVVRREEAEARARRVVGRAASARLAPGHRFTLEGHPFGRLDGEYFLTEVSYEVSQRHRNAASSGGVEGRPFVSTFAAIPRASAYRPEENSPAPIQPGLQSGLVVGPPGEDVHPDEAGRVRVKLRWDRSPILDERAGKWVRISQRGTADSMLLPRIGWTVLTVNEEGSVDAPTILSRIHDGEHPPTYTLPAVKTRVVYKTATTPSDGSFNEIYFEDLKGAEEMFINASRDMSVLTQHVKAESIGRNHRRAVGVDLDLEVGHDMSETVQGSQSMTIGAEERVTVGASRTKKVDGAEHASIGGAREIAVGATYDGVVVAHRTLTVGGAMTEESVGSIQLRSDTLDVDVGGTLSRRSASSIAETVGGAATVTIGGYFRSSAGRSAILSTKSSFTENVGGSMTLTCGGTFTDGARVDSSWKVGGALSGEAPKVLVEAASQIVLKCGGSSIVITPSSIRITSPALDLSGAHLEVDTGIVTHN